MQFIDMSPVIEHFPTFQVSKTQAGITLGEKTARWIGEAVWPQVAPRKSREQTEGGETSPGPVTIAFDFNQDAIQIAPGCHIAMSLWISFFNLFLSSAIAGPGQSQEDDLLRVRWWGGEETKRKWNWAPGFSISPYLRKQSYEIISCRCSHCTCCSWLWAILVCWRRRCRRFNKKTPKRRTRWGHETTKERAFWRTKTAETIPDGLRQDSNLH